MYGEDVIVSCCVFVNVKIIEVVVYCLLDVLCMFFYGWL